jgi:hypothetical protein
MKIGGIILSLCDHSGEWSRPWAEAGYEVRKVDLQDGQDARLLEWIDSPVTGILAAPPLRPLRRVRCPMVGRERRTSHPGRTRCRRRLSSSRRHLPANLVGSRKPYRTTLQISRTTSLVLRPLRFRRPLHQTHPPMGTLHTTHPNRMPHSQKPRRTNRGKQNAQNERQR